VRSIVVSTRRFRASSRSARGQALVEFSIAIIPFLILLMGILDLGRAMYQMNTTAEAAREIARVTSVHRWSSCTAAVCNLGSHADSQAVIATQRDLLPSIAFDSLADIECVDVADTVQLDRLCGSGDFVRVRVRSTFEPVLPLLSMFGPQTFESYSRIEVP
jgi:hypothetical protein